MRIDGCRSCGGSDLVAVLDLGRMPLADRLRSDGTIDDDEPRYPLELAFCRNCALVQITYTVPPEELFCRDYPYFSSFSPALLEHSRSNALELIDRRGLGPESFVVEIASNDGYLLRNFVEQGIPVLGVDPAEGPARAAEACGVPTRNTFFNSSVAAEILARHSAADVILANNVLAHVADTNDLVKAIGILLDDDGVATIEVPYVRDLIDHCEFDTIYHEHLCYFSLTALVRLFNRHRLFVNDVRRLDIHGGSLRIYVGHRHSPTDAVIEMLRTESAIGLDRLPYFEDFARRVQGLKDGLSRQLADLRAQGNRIAAYGAAAKGSTMINYVGIGHDLVDYVVDRNFHKHGKYMPGQRLRIFPTEKLAEDRPDFVLLLAWNFAREIMSQQDHYRRAGGRFIIPGPEPRII